MIHDTKSVHLQLKSHKKQNNSAVIAVFHLKVTVPSPRSKSNSHFIVVYVFFYLLCIMHTDLTSHALAHFLKVCSNSMLLHHCPRS